MSILVKNKMFKFAPDGEYFPLQRLNILIMNFSFDDLKLLVTVVAQDLVEDDFDNFQDGFTAESFEKDFKFGVSEEMYDKVHLLSGLLNELYKHRPLPY